MRTDTIPVSEMEKYMAIYKVETRVKERLHRLLEITEYKLKLAESIKKDLEYLNNFKREFRLDKSVRTLLTPIISENISIPRLRKALGIEEE